MPSWLFGGGLIASCALIPPALTGLKAPTSQATILGALLIQSTGVVLLTLDSRLPTESSGLATIYIVAGVTGASMRVLQLVRDLAHLGRPGTRR